MISCFSPSVEIESLYTYFERCLSLSSRFLLPGSIHQGSIALELKMAMNSSLRLLKKEYRWEIMSLFLHSQATVSFLLQHTDLLDLTESFIK